MKNNKGITLIALVITIIVLLILAGVAIAMLTGENSILTRSTDTKYAQEIAKAKDEISLKVNEFALNYFEDKYVVESETAKATLTEAIVTELKSANIKDLTDANVELVENTLAYTAATDSAEESISGHIKIKATGRAAITSTGTFDGKVLKWTDNFNSTK